VDLADRPAEFVAYLDAIGELPALRRGKQLALAMLDLQSGERVLDVGSGLGDDIRAIAARVGPNGRCVGIDRSATMLAEAWRRTSVAGPIQFVQADATALPFPDATFDAARADRVLMFLPDPQLAVAEMARVLRPGGRLVLTEPDWDTLVVAAVDHDLTRAVARQIGDSAPNGRIGRALADLARAAPVRVDLAEAWSLLLDDFDTADRLWQLSAMTAAAVQRGIVTAAAGGAWLADLRERGAAGRFFCSVTGFGVRGVKAV
jgi:ubiquinone/menaquinone biosynthesis C-methylase UbiE